jgi:tRNA (mo5U34)-methyltransferase
MESLKDEIRSLGPWHYDIEVAPGIRTGAPEFSEGAPAELGRPTVTDPLADMRRLIGETFENGLEGRSFLDCACNAGGHSFGAKALGAGRVFGFDAREHWIRQAQFLARFLPSENVHFERKELAELDPGEDFDVTLFRGIFYHLPDPIAGIRLAADRTRELIIVNSAGKPGSEPGLVLNIESDTPLMSGVDRLAWLPTGPETVQAILTWCGFAHTRVRFDVPTANGWSRMEVRGARDASTFAYYDSIEHKLIKHPVSAPDTRLRRAIRRLRKSISSR